MRFDVNVSVRPAGSDELRTRTRAEEHELVQLRREGDREGDRAPDQDLRVGRDGRAGDAALRPRATRTRRRSAPRRRRRTTATSPSPTSCRSSRRRSSSSGCARRCGELPSDRIKRIAETLSFYDADVLVTGGLDRLWSDVVEAGADPKETANVLANAFVAAGVDPAARRIRPSSRSSSRRAPRSRARRSTRRSRTPGDDGFTRRARTSRRRPSATSPSSTRSSTPSSPPTPARPSSTAAARRACSASSSAR